MIISEKAPQWFWRCAAFLFALQTHVYLFGTSYFQAGFWSKQEPRLVAIFLFSTLTCVWFWQGFYKKWLHIDRAVSPLFWLMLGWAGWQAFVTVISATSSWHSWFGDVDFGQGAGWYVCVVLLGALAFALWPRLAYRKFIFFAAVSALFLMYGFQLQDDAYNPFRMGKLSERMASVDDKQALAKAVNVVLFSTIDVDHPVFDSQNIGDAIRYKFEGRQGLLKSWVNAVDKDLEQGFLAALKKEMGDHYPRELQQHDASSWTVYGWPDYLAFVIGWVWMIAHFAFPAMGRKKQSWITLAALVAMVFVGNKTALVFFVCAVIATRVMAGYAQFRGADFLPVRPFTRKLMCAACLAGLAYTLLCYQPTLFTGGYSNGSISQRVHMNAVALHAITDEPSRLLLGHGWASFQNDLLKYAMLDQVSMFKNGKLDPNLNTVMGNAAHSHNQPLEALLASGFVGCVLWFAMAFIVILRVPDRLFWRVVPIHVAMVLTSYFWFPVSFLIGFMALYWAAAIHATADDRKPELVDAGKSQWLALAFIPLGFIMLYSTVEQYRAMRYSEWLHDALYAPYRDYPMELILEDAGRGGERLRAITSLFVADLINNYEIEAKVKDYEYLKHVAMAPDVHRWVERLLAAGYLMGMDPRSGVHAGSMDLALQFFLQTKAMAGDDYDKARADSFLFYPAAVVRLARTAPLREDFAAPYLYHLEQSGDKPTLTLMLARLLDANPKHRIALWITGKYLSKQAGKEEKGKALMRQALDAGVARIYLITPEEEAAAREE